MAVAKHLGLLNQGLDVWNAWREQNPKLRPGLTGAKLNGRNFRYMDLKKVNLSGADLNGADLKETDLGWADLSGTDLRGADLEGARLLFADLTGADLTRTKGLTRDQIEEAVIDPTTRLPEYIRRER